MSMIQVQLRRWERRGFSDRVPAFVEAWGRKAFFFTVLLSTTIVAGLSMLWQPAALLGIFIVVFAWIGLSDIIQARHAVLRNYPVLGHLRYFAESIRPELRQYFVESDQEANPFSREMRSVVYRRAKVTLDTVPFGTHRDVYLPSYEWLNHSLEPAHPGPDAARVIIGHHAKLPYSCSLLNISAMSYGSLSSNAILALNEGAKRGGFAHNTGEGGISPYHLRPGGDLVWQVGTGYFGCRDEHGGFSLERFSENAQRDTVRMIELKLSQGAKPAHGGILPAQKLTAEIAEIRGVPMGKDVLSPPKHSAFDGPRGLLEFLTQLRELSGGKPVGFKLCVGHPVEVMAIVKAMLETQMFPDFITVDGGEGGTGAAPLEFSNSVGTPLADGLSLVHNALRGAGVRDKMMILSAGKISTGFHIVRQLALGADACNSARSMMFALGCIQALKCNSNHCPVGVATQDPDLVRGLDVEDKARRVANFHKKTIESVLELVGAAGITDPADLRPHHVSRRIDESTVSDMAELYPWLEEGSLLQGGGPEHYRRWWSLASPDHFRPVASSRTSNSPAG